MQAQAFGSVDQTDDRRSCQRSRSPLQGPLNGAIAIREKKESENPEGMKDER